MKLYLAWYSTWKKRLPTINVWQNYLETYLVAKKWDMEKEYAWSKKKRFLDSWAFSAKTLWIKIDINEYIDFILKNKKFFEVYANLDVIWDAEATDRNQKLMEAKWLKPLPTYHLWEPKKFFEELVNNYEYIWIWGLVPYARQPKKIENCLDYCFSYIFKNKLKTKFHWWWMTNPIFMKKYPFYSVDSTAWLSWWKFKNLMFFSNWTLQSMSCADIRKKYWVDHWNKHYMELNILNIEALYKYVDYITKLHQAKWLEYWL